MHKHSYARHSYARQRPKPPLQLNSFALLHTLYLNYDREQRRTEKRTGGSEGLLYLRGGHDQLRSLCFTGRGLYEGRTLDHPGLHLCRHPRDTCHAFQGGAGNGHAEIGGCLFLHSAQSRSPLRDLRGIRLVDLPQPQERLRPRGYRSLPATAGPISRRQCGQGHCGRCDPHLYHTEHRERETDRNGAGGHGFQSYRDPALLHLHGIQPHRRTELRTLSPGRLAFTLYGYGHDLYLLRRIDQDRLCGRRDQESDQDHSRQHVFRLRRRDTSLRPDGFCHRGTPG